MTEQTTDQTTHQPVAEPTPTPDPAPVRRLTRSRDDKVIGGVCGGIAEYTGMDVTLIRLLTVVGVVFGFGSVAVAYIVAWILLPKG